jgi:hypothetical protein
VVEDIIEQAARTAWESGLWWQAIAIILVGAVVVVVWRRLRLGALIGAGLRRWHVATKDANTDPERPVKGMDPIPLDQKRPETWE